MPISSPSLSMWSLLNGWVYSSIRCLDSFVSRGVHHLLAMSVRRRLSNPSPGSPSDSVAPIVTSAPDPQVVSVPSIVLHFSEPVFRPPARHPDPFLVLIVLVSTPVVGLIWLWPIESGIWASCESEIAVFGSGNPGIAHTDIHPQQTDPLPALTAF